MLDNCSHYSKNTLATIYMRVSNYCTGKLHLNASNSREKQIYGIFGRICFFRSWTFHVQLSINIYCIYIRTEHTLKPLRVVHATLHLTRLLPRLHLLFACFVSIAYTLLRHTLFAYTTHKLSILRLVSLNVEQSLLTKIGSTCSKKMYYLSHKVICLI